MVKRFSWVLLLCVFMFSLAGSKDVYGLTQGIPILMFHRFSSVGTGDYTIATKDFRKILMVLSKPHYCLIDLTEYVNASFLSRCKGKKPFALSMDDGHSSQFRFLSDGSVDKTSGLGVLLEVFPNAKATLFLNVNNGGAPFGKDSKTKIAWLRKNNFTIGNHTVSHPIMSQLSSRAVVREIDGACRYFGKSSMLLAYPYGLMPPKPISSYKTTCQTSAAFRAWLGYFEGMGQTKESGVLLAPMPNTKAFSSRRFSYPRLNIHSYQDFVRDVFENTAWAVVK